MRTLRHKITSEIFKFILEQNRRGIAHKRIAKMVKDRFDYPIGQKEIGKLVRSDNGLDESSQYEVE